MTNSPLLENFEAIHHTSRLTTTMQCKYTSKGSYITTKPIRILLQSEQSKREPSADYQLGSNQPKDNIIINFVWQKRQQLHSVNISEMHTKLNIDNQSYAILQQSYAPKRRAK